MKKSLVFCTLLSLMYLSLEGHSISENVFNENAFFKKYTLFRFSLYSDIAPVELDSVNSYLGLFTQKKIEEKCNQFLTENIKDIRLYKKLIIEKSESGALSLEKYKDVSVEFISADLSDIINQFQTNKIYQIINLNPIAEIYYLTTMILSRHGTATEIRDTTLRKSVGGFLFHIEERSNDLFTISINQYDYVFIFNIDIQKLITKPKMVYKRIN